MPAARATIKCSRRCACTCATRRKRCMTARSRWRRRSTRSRRVEGSIVLPGYTHMQQAMPSTVALWALGFAAEIRDDAQGLAARGAARSEEPARFRRGIRYSESRSEPRVDATRPRVRGHAGARDRCAAVARQGRGASLVRDHAAHAGHRTSRRRLAALLHAGVRLREFAGGVHHRFLHHAPEAQSGRVRADARAQRRGACRAQRGARRHREARLRLPSRSAAHQAAAVPRRSTRAARRSISCRARSRASPFRPDKIRLDPGIDAAAAANALVAREKIPFREAYQRVAAQLKDRK